MSDDQLQQITGELAKTTEQLQDTQQYVKEIQIQHSIDALILAGLVAVVFQTFSYLIYGTILTDLDAILYMFSLLIGPSAFFLLLLHLYELYGVVKRGEKSIPLTLDLMYFIYLVIALCHHDWIKFLLPTTRHFSEIFNKWMESCSRIALYRSNDCVAPR